MKASQNEEYYTSFHDCDIQKITNGIYIGDQYAAGNKKLLNDLQINHIVVVGHQLKPLHPKLFTYLHVPVKDNRREKISEYFAITNEFIKNILERKESVLIHCAKGISRSATIIMAFLMYRFKMDYCDALAYVRRKRNQVMPNEGFVFQLKNYHQQLRLLRVQA